MVRGGRDLKGISILGSTGSIGLSTLDVLSRHPDKYELIAITANKDLISMIQQCIDWNPKYAVMADDKCARELEQTLRTKGLKTKVLSGQSGLEEVASLPETDFVMAAIVGAAGLIPTLAAARAGKRVLLANKEALVLSGKLFMDAVDENGAELMPIDSEHNAVFQCMPPNFPQGLQQCGVVKILLTASGGPFRELPMAELASVTPEQACAHPNWDMGRKISVDSATMMNKGLEVIEACWLFDTTPDYIEVVIHPQSVIHSLVQYEDGSVLAQLGNPDMRTPIAHALSWPDRITSGVKSLDLFEVAQLDFHKPDLNRFPCLQLAAEAMKSGGTATAILNAANEVAVDQFLLGKIKFTEISQIVEESLNKINMETASSLDVVLAADAEARGFARQVIQDLAA
jgi:1-deoxy-D-xylulose-5-phosphate reductoisomerase